MLPLNIPKLALTAAVFLSFSPSLFAAEETLIDTKFSEVDSTGTPLITEVPNSFASLPLTKPTFAKGERGAQGNEPSITASKVAIGDFNPPFLILNTGERDGSPDVAGDLNLAWRLTALKLGSGVYQLKFKTGAGQVDKGGFGIQVLMHSPTPDPELKLHPNNLPFVIWFQKGGQIRIGGLENGNNTPIKYHIDEPIDFDITLDLDEKKWSLEANGKRVIDKVDFPNFLKEGDYFLDSIKTLSTAGVGTSPNAQYYLGDVKLIKLK